MLAWNLMMFILLTNTHKVVNRIINNRIMNNHSKNFKRNPEEKSQYWNQQHLPHRNRLKHVNPESTFNDRWNPEAVEAWKIKRNAGYFEIENKDRKVDWDIEATPVEEDWYIETSTKNVNTPSNLVKMSIVGGTRNQFPRIIPFRNPAKRQKQVDDERGHNVKQDTWIVDKYQGQFLDEVPGTVLSEDSEKTHEGGTWMKRQPVKLINGDPVKRVTGGMPAVCVPVTKKVYKCRTIKYRGRGITYCWYELVDEEDCASLD